MTSTRKASGISLVSRLTTGWEEEPDYEEMSDESLRECLETAIHTNKLLALENMVFERYLRRHDPQALVTMAQVLETAKQVQRSASLIAPMTSTQNFPGSVRGSTSIRDKISMSPSTDRSMQTSTGSRRYGSALIPQSKNLRITLNHRIEMTNKEIEEMKKHLVNLEQQTIKKKANLRAQVEEIQLRIKDIQEAKTELEENVIKRGIDPVSGKLPAEKLIKFMEDWIKAADRIVEKLRLKTLSLKQQIKKSKIQLQQREELGETLHPIDFEVLAIENHDYLKKIEEKNVDLAELKRITGRYNLQLNTKKNKLYEQRQVLKNMEREIELKEKQIEKLKVEGQNIKEEVERTDREMEEIKKLMEERKMPNVLEFIKMQAELQEMRKTYKRLERRKKIQMIALNTYKQHQKLLNQSEVPKKFNSGMTRCPNGFLSTPSV
ncbi:coiled-coil domain-containing protein 113 [Diachasma alloeum]|uniref:coiled-coil domain-containing protein 113 n=1 Tax=Diachasma alloeum TaxID=454923 RepID=UPI0007383415|nr:coiled-coil domain-containing protein 113 [Diachasma alloeum]